MEKDQEMIEEERIKPKSDYNKVYYLEHREDILNYGKNWRLMHPEYMSNYCKIWRLEHPDYNKIWCLLHPDYDSTRRYLKGTRLLDVSLWDKGYRPN